MVQNGRQKEMDQMYTLPAGLTVLRCVASLGLIVPRHLSVQFDVDGRSWDGTRGIRFNDFSAYGASVGELCRARNAETNPFGR